MYYHGGARHLGRFFLFAAPSRRTSLTPKHRSDASDLPGVGLAAATAAGQSESHEAKSLDSSHRAKARYRRYISTKERKVFHRKRTGVKDMRVRVCRDKVTGLIIQSKLRLSGGGSL